MKTFKSNSDKERENQAKRIEPVANGTAKKKKIFADSFLAEDVNRVKSYILLEVIVPTLKKAISDVVTTGINMFLYGDSGNGSKSNPASRVSYQKYYEPDNHQARSGYTSSKNTGIQYDEILFDTCGDAEAVLNAMYDIINQYGSVSVSDFYDLARVPNDNFTMNRYGWTNLYGTTAMRVRDGYILKLPRSIPLS